MEIRINMWLFLKVAGVEQPTDQSFDETIVFDNSAYVALTGIDPEGKTGEELAVGLAKAYWRDNGKPDWEPADE